jgi:penicillin-binding protein 1A
MTTAKKRKAGAGGSKADPKPKKARDRRALLVRSVAIAFFLGSLALAGLVAVFAYYGRDLPTVASLKRYDPPQTSRVVDRRGHVIAEMWEERRTVVPMSKIPRVLVLAVLAAEDADFYRHRGLDYAGIVRALVRDLVSGRAMQGASTITQQIVKNLLLSSERTVSRKVKELILARRLEQELGKDEILFLYLNHINFGHGRYGVQEASRFYFGKNVGDLDLAEASMLAGLPQAPGRLSPFKHPEAAKARQRYVLDQLAQKRAEYWDDLPAAAIATARTKQLVLVGDRDAPNAAPEVATYARELLERVVGAERAAHGGYRVETTLDLDLQRGARAALREGLTTVDARQKLVGPLRVPKAKAKLERVKALAVGRNYEATVVDTDDRAGALELDVAGHRASCALSLFSRQNPARLSASAFAPIGARLMVSVETLDARGSKASVRPLLGPQGAVVVIDPRSREVLALVGGDEASYGFDRALSAVRQPGSAFKPITYALAIESKKLTPASLVLDAPEVFDKWKPDNYETWNPVGALRLREAVAQSVNMVAVRVMSELTPQAVVDFAAKLGIATPLEPSLALSLGASEVRPIELVNAYATFAAGGRFAPYRIVRKIVDRHGKRVAMPGEPAEAQVMSPAAAYVLTSMLRSVVDHGTAKAAAKLGRPLAGKTGTSNNARDTWFVGFSPELVAGVWVGFDDHRALGKGESGAKAALPIWMAVMVRALHGQPAVEFPVPRGVEHVLIDPKSGLRAYEGQQDPLDEVFVEGTAPIELALPPDVQDTDDFIREQLGGGAPP